MLFTQTVAVALSVAATSAIQFTNTNYGTLQVGKPFTFTYSDANPGDVTILISPGGASTGLTFTQVIATGSGGSATFTPTDAGTFAFSIKDSSGQPGPSGSQNPNYSGQYPVKASDGSIPTSTQTTATGQTTATSPVSSTTTGVTSVVKPANTTSSTTTLTSIVKIANVTSTATTSTKSIVGSVAIKSGVAGATGSGFTPAPSTLQASSATTFASPFAFVFLTLAALVTLN